MSPAVNVNEHEKDPFRTVVAFAPLVFGAHVAEEVPGLVQWFNATVVGGMTVESFWRVNLAVLVITIIVGVMVWLSSSVPTAVAAVVWLSFIMGGNSVVHIAATLVQRQYVPGFVTALIAYLPYFSLVLVYARRRGVSRTGLLLAVGVGALPMLIQGYLVLFRATRLF